MAAAALFSTVIMLLVTACLYQKRKETEAAIAARKYAQNVGNTRFREGTILYQGKTYRRVSHIKAILCMGVDRRGVMTEDLVPAFGGQADGIFLLAQDTARNHLKILMIPRDAMTEITMTDLSGNVLGKDVQHLTLAYAYGNGREESCERMEEAVSGLLGGFSIDHYLAADTNVINMLNNYVGGVTVTVPTTGMEKRDPAFIKGKTITLREEQAEAFVRYRDTEEAHSAIYRLEQQREYIKGFFQAVKEGTKKNSQLVPDMFHMIEDYIVTDMVKEEYLKIAVDALNMDGLTDNDFYTVPGQSVTTEFYDEFYADQESLTPIILDMFYREIS